MKTLIIYTIAIMCWMAWRFFTLLSKFSTSRGIVIATVVLMTTFSTGNAQTVHATFAPEKLGCGLILEQPIFENVSLLASYDRGMYRIKDDWCQCTNKVGIQKFGAGVRYNWAMVLVQYNDIFKEYNPTNAFNISKVKNVSVELGAMLDLTDKIQSGIIYDVINYEARLTVGYRLR